MSDTINREYATRYFIGLQALDKITNDNYDGKITFDEVIARLGVIPSAEPEIIRCGQCKYAEAADSEDSQDGYTCQFHRGSIWFSGSYCSWAERREECTP